MDVPHADGRRRDKPTVSYQSAGYEVSKCPDEICPLWPYRSGREVEESRPKKNKARIPQQARISPL